MNKCKYIIIFLQKETAVETFLPHISDSGQYLIESNEFLLKKLNALGYNFKQYHFTVICFCKLCLFILKKFIHSFIFKLFPFRSMLWTVHFVLF